MVNGTLHPDFAGMAKYIDKFTGGRKRQGGAIAVYHRGEKVVDVWGGPRNPAGDPWLEDTVAMAFSTTKGVASTALHVCASRGLIDYDEPVATYWPEFGAAGKEAVTVRHVLTHSAGLHRLRGLLTDIDDVLDWDTMTTLLAARPSEPAAGTGPGYHGVTYGWLVGELVRRVTGQTLSAFVRTELAEPLGLDGLHIGLPSSELPRVAPLHPVPTEKRRQRAERFSVRLERWGPTQRLAEALLVDDMDQLLFDRHLELVQAEVPALNGTFTARSLARLYAAMANGGELDGVRIMSAEHAALAGARQPQADMRDYCIKLNMKWRLGYHQAFTLGRMPPNGFGHFGFGGSGAWADPETDLAVAFVTNDIGAGSTPFGDTRLVRIGGAARRIARKR